MTAVFSSENTAVTISRRLVHKSPIIISRDSFRRVLVRLRCYQICFSVRTVKAVECSADRQLTTACEWATYFARQPPTVCQLFQKTIKIRQLLLVVPATAAGAERLFSSLRRLKTWLRKTMTQTRLTHLALLHCHRHRAEGRDIQALVTWNLR